MSKTLVKAIPVVSFLIIFIFLFYGLYKDPTEIPSPLIGKKVPSFELRDLEKRKIFQSNDFMGENLELKTKNLINGKRKFSGKLTECNDVTFTIEDIREPNILKFKFTDLDLCKLKPNYNNLIKEHSHAK